MQERSERFCVAMSLDSPSHSNSHSNTSRRRVRTIATVAKMVE